MQDILNQLKENPEILKNLLNDKECIEDIQNDISKKVDINEQTVKLIVKAMQMCIQSENKIDTLNENELYNVQGGLAIPAWTINFACDAILSYIGTNAGRSAGRQLNRHGYYPYSKSSTTDTSSVEDQIHDLGWRQGHTAGVSQALGTCVGLAVSVPLSKEIISFLKKHNVEIT